MIETKSTQLRDAEGKWSDEVQEKEKSGKKWCAHASDYLQANGGKAWRYLLIPDDQVSEQKSLSWFSDHFSK